MSVVTIVCCCLLTGTPKALLVASAVCTQLLQTACVDLVLQSVVTKPAEEREWGRVRSSGEGERGREEAHVSASDCCSLIP